MNDEIEFKEIEVERAREEHRNAALFPSSSFSVAHQNTKSTIAAFFLNYNHSSVFFARDSPFTYFRGGVSPPFSRSV